MALAQSLDHFVVPVDDIVVAEDFWTPLCLVCSGRVQSLDVS